MMTANEIRQLFLDYFASKGHKIVKSSSLIPHDDPTLLFTNAGMNQFKNLFLGLEHRDYSTAVSSQKCVRAGGKHNDLENVGYTARHHTFFEMLGNFSFGAYFKLEALTYAWQFLTEVVKLPKDKLYVTVYHTDDEAYNIWINDIGLSADRIIRIGDKSSGGSDNFWQMGDTGPCGPCSEIFYDHGPEIKGGLPGSAEEDGDRYIEIWNCVFMQFNRDETGKLNPLPKPSVDTGMGLERLSAVLQHVHNNYDIDLFRHLINAAALILKQEDKSLASLKVIADHIRAICFLIADGVIPANEGRGYVLRRIIRRALRHGYILGEQQPFLFKLVKHLTQLMGNYYTELNSTQSKIENILKQEEEKFLETIVDGMAILKKELATTNKILNGEIAFKLYDTYGFPLDLTQDICREQNILVDIKAYDKCMLKQKEMAKAASKFKQDMVLNYDGVCTSFNGYTTNSIEAKVTAIYVDNNSVNKLEVGQNAILVLDKTVFYAEGGGQVGDTGIIAIEGGVEAIFSVTDTQKLKSDVFGHIGQLSSGQISVGDMVTATYDLHQRLATARNHSVTHLLHKALQEVLGLEAKQKGSLVCSEYTRFDFAYDKPITNDQITHIERIVNHVIMMNYAVEVKLMKYDEAIKYGAMALFGEKYTDDVRVITMGEFSIELCGGTHVSKTGDIGLFTIVSESGVASGVRRIEAITGENAIQRIQDNALILDNLKTILKAQDYDVVLDKVNQSLDNGKLLLKQIEELQLQIAVLQADQYLTKAIALANGTKLLCLKLKNMENKVLANLVEQLKNKLGDAIVVLMCINNDKVNIVVGVSSKLTKQYLAGQVVGYLSQQLGGKGGGRADFAQGAGVDITKVDQVLALVQSYLENK
ncbi:MAG: alanine--tRNA ligase [Burkholderiales bacterium]|nr:alanine--tRNA ligase [Burkholderiales bacterium]